MESIYFKCFDVCGSGIKKKCSLGTVITVSAISLRSAHEIIHFWRYSVQV